MSIFFGTFVLMVVLATVIGYSVIILLWPNRFAVEQMLWYLKKRLLQNNTLLIPITPTAIAQWSTARDQRTHTGFFWAITSGCFKTLDGQPIMLYARCRYRLGRTVLAVRHHDRLWFILQTGERFDLFYNEALIGYIDNNEAIYDYRGQLWGQLRYENRRRFVYLRVHDADLATFVINTRGLDQTAAILPCRTILPHEENLFVAVVVWLYAA